MKEINLVFEISLFILRSDSLHALKFYGMGPNVLLPLRRYGVLWIFIALKNPSPSPGLNLRTFGPMTSTLTITAPRQMEESLHADSSRNSNLA
jgi:hypothetical protein